jgi:hypothetical protein
VQLPFPKAAAEHFTEDGVPEKSFFLFRARNRKNYSEFRTMPSRVNTYSRWP